jgi:hypothetical protein
VLRKEVVQQDQQCNMPMTKPSPMTKPLAEHYQQPGHGEHDVCHSTALQLVLVQAATHLPILLLLLSLIHSLPRCYISWQHHASLLDVLQGFATC